MVYRDEDRDAVFALLHRVWEQAEGTGRILRMLLEDNPDMVAERMMLEDMDSLAVRYPEISRQNLDIWVRERKHADISRISDYLQRNQIGMMYRGYGCYPTSLEDISDSPAILYYKGTPDFSALSIGIVGSRNADRYGLMMAESLGNGLSTSGICIVSGLAKGIDAAAHDGALRGKGGTVAVQGCGMDKIYPKQNSRLANAILEHERGCILSEFPLGGSSEPWHFPKRNRIISGLSKGVIAVQATRKSGVFSTIESALNQGKDVFAVPGNADNPLSCGPNLFIKEGAILVDSASDVLEFYGLEEESQCRDSIDYHHEKVSLQRENDDKIVQSDDEFDNLPENILLTDDEKSVLLLFQREPLSVESLLRLSGKAAGDLTAVLSMLEVYGLIRQQPGRYYIRIR